MTETARDDPPIGLIIVGWMLAGVLLIGAWLWSEIDAAQDQAVFDDALLVCNVHGGESQACKDASDRASREAGKFP